MPPLAPARTGDPSGKEPSLHLPRQLPTAGRPGWLSSSPATSPNESAANERSQLGGLGAAHPRDVSSCLLRNAPLRPPPQAPKGGILEEPWAGRGPGPGAARGWRLQPEHSQASRPGSLEARGVLSAPPPSKVLEPVTCARVQPQEGPAQAPEPPGQSRTPGDRKHQPQTSRALPAPAPPRCPEPPLFGASQDSKAGAGRGETRCRAWEGGGREATPTGAGKDPVCPGGAGPVPSWGGVLHPARLGGAGQPGTGPRALSGALASHGDPGGCRGRGGLGEGCRVPRVQGWRHPLRGAWWGAHNLEPPAPQRGLQPPVQGESQPQGNLQGGHWLQLIQPAPPPPGGSSRACGARCHLHIQAYTPCTMCTHSLGGNTHMHASSMPRCTRTTEPSTPPHTHGVICTHNCLQGNVHTHTSNTA